MLIFPFSLTLMLQSCKGTVKSVNPFRCTLKGFPQWSIRSNQEFVRIALLAILYDPTEVSFVGALYSKILTCYVFPLLGLMIISSDRS